MKTSYRVECKQLPYTSIWLKGSFEIRANPTPGSNLIQIQFGDMNDNTWLAIGNQPLAVFTY